MFADDTTLFFSTIEANSGLYVICLILTRAPVHTNRTHAPPTKTSPPNPPRRTHLRRFVPHVGNVLVLAVVLRPGTCQVRASERALRGPQLDATAGDREENEERRALRGRGGGRRRTRR